MEKMFNSYYKNEVGEPKYKDDLNNSFRLLDAKSVISEPVEIQDSELIDKILKMTTRESNSEGS